MGDLVDNGSGQWNWTVDGGLWTHWKAQNMMVDPRQANQLQRQWLSRRQKAGAGPEDYTIQRYPSFSSG